MTDNRPDLPELESVEARTYGMLLFPCIILGLSLVYIVFMVQSYLKHHGLPQSMPTRAMVSSAMLVVFAVAALAVILRNYYRWKTDIDGLTAIGLFGSKRIRWQDISESTTRTNWIGETMYRLIAGGSVLRIPYLIPSNGWQESVLIASVWQHLRRHGKSEGLTMSANAQSLWDEIPAELPHELEAMSPKVPGWQAMALLYTAVLSYFAYNSYVVLHAGNYVVGVFGLLFWMVIAVLAYTTGIRSAMRTAWRVRVNNDAVEGELGRQIVRFPWSQITHARWDRQTNRLRLLLETDARKTQLVIPINRTDDQSLMLALGIIRNLRAVGLTAVIPDIFRGQPDPTDGTLSGGGIEVRLPWGGKVVVSFYAALCGFCAVMLPTQGKAPILYVVGAIAFSALVGWVVSGTYEVIVDDQGVSKRFLGIRKFVAWEQVAEAKPRMLTNSGTTQAGVILKDANGKTLMDVSYGTGSMQDRDALRTALASRLVGTAASQPEDSPWKSRPWTPGQ